MKLIPSRKLSDVLETRIIAARAHALHVRSLSDFDGEDSVEDAFHAGMENAKIAADAGKNIVYCTVLDAEADRLLILIMATSEEEAVKLAKTWPEG